MSEFTSQLKALWVRSRQRQFHQDTRGIMTPEQRMVFEGAFDALMAEHERQVSQSAWDEGFDAGWAECSDPGAFVNDVWDAKTPNPYVKGQTNE